MEHKSRLRELFEQFVSTELVSPLLLECLEERLVEVLGHDVDTEIIRNSLVDLSASAHRAKSPPLQKPVNNRKNTTDSYDAGFWLDEDDNSPRNAKFDAPPPLMVQRKTQSIADELARNSAHFRAFRQETMDMCKQLVHELWRLKRGHNNNANDDGNNNTNGKTSDGKKEPYTIEQKRSNGFLSGFHSFSLPSDSNDDDDGFSGGHNATVLALSSFSLEHSMQEWPEEEMQNIVWLICSDGADQNIRLTNIQKLHLVSPLAFSKSKAFEIFLGHLHAILPIPLLFRDTMHLLARILSCPNELIWARSANCLSRVALGVMRSPTLGREDKLAFTDFFRQLFSIGPRLWRNFDYQYVSHIVQSFMEMLTSEISAGGGGGPTSDGFLAILAQTDPELNWIRPWLHRQSVRTLMMPKFAELVHEVLEHHVKAEEQFVASNLDNDNNSPRHSPLFWAFQCSILCRCLQQSSLFKYLHEIVPDPVQLRHSFCNALLNFLSMAFSPPTNGLRPKGSGAARRVVVEGLLETTMSDCGAGVLCSEYFLVPLFSLPPFVAAIAAKVSFPGGLSAPSSSLPKLELPLKVLFNLLTYSPNHSNLPRGAPFLFSKVEKTVRQLLNLLQYHTDDPFAMELTVQVLDLLFERFPIDQLLPLFTDLIYTLVIPRISKLDPSNPDHRRLIIATAYLTVFDNNSPYQWRQWRKTVGKALNRVSLRAAYPADISPAQPHHIWMTFPVAIELTEAEQHVAANVLLQFLGLQKDELAISKSAGSAGPSQQINGQMLRPTHGHSATASIISGPSEAGSSTNLSSSAGEDTMEKFLLKSVLQRLNCLDFLPWAPTEFRMSLQPSLSDSCLPSPIFLLLTQPGLITYLFKFARVGQQLMEQIAAFERQKESGKHMTKFFGRLDILMINLDVVVELRQFVPNLGARLVQLIHKFCSDFAGSLFLDDLSRRICLFLSHSIVAAPTERRFRQFRRMDQMQQALADVPESLYRQSIRWERRAPRRNGRKKKTRWKEWDEDNGCDESSDEEEEEEEGGSEEDDKTKDGKNGEQDVAGGQENGEWMALGGKESAEGDIPKGGKSFEGWEEDECSIMMRDGRQNGVAGGDVDDRRQRQRSLSLRLGEADATFWFSILPPEDTPAARMELIRTLFSPIWRTKHPTRPFEVLREFAKRFWHRSENNRINVRPPSHSEWFSMVADYAAALEVVPEASRAQLRQRMNGLRLMAPAPNDWFLSALFLASALSADATMDFCERFIEQRSSSSSPSVCAVWPLCCSATSSQFCSVPSLFGSNAFADHIAKRVFPRVLSLLQRNAEFRALGAFLCSSRVPSLLHLLLLYTNQAYLGILPFRAVQEYLLVAVLGGTELQALHFCAVLAHIFQRSISRRSLHFSAKVIPLFLRPELLANFDFAKYAHLFEEGTLPGK